MNVRIRHGQRIRSTGLVRDDLQLVDDRTVSGQARQTARLFAVEMIDRVAVFLHRISLHPMVGRTVVDETLHLFEIERPDRLVFLLVKKRQLIGAQLDKTRSRTHRTRRDNVHFIVDLLALHSGTTVNERKQRVEPINEPLSTDLRWKMKIDKMKTTNENNQISKPMKTAVGIESNISLSHK